MSDFRSPPSGLSGLGVLFVAAFPFPGPHGGPVYAAGLAQALARRGHRVAFVTGPDGTGPAPEGVDLLRVPRLPGAPRVTGSGPHWTRVWNDVGLVRAVRRQLRRRAIDIVHAHHVEATLLARAALGRKGPPLVQSVHASLADELPQWFPGLRGAGRLGAALDRRALAAADCNLAISASGKAWLDRLGVPAEVVPPGVDIHDLIGGHAKRARAAWELRGDVVVYTGNTDPYQELDRLVEAMAATTATLLVVTVDPTAPLEALADRVGLPRERRRFVQSASFQDAKDAIAAANLFVVPRTKCAGFPMKLLNALGAGVPAVVAASAGLEAPGCVEFDHAVEGDLARVISSLLADPMRRNALGDRAMWAVADSGTWDARAQAMEQVYEKLTAAGAGMPDRNG